MAIDLANYPQLRLICWHITGAKTISEDEAFYLYQRHWRFIDENKLSNEEKMLLSKLILKIGKGNFNPKFGVL